MSCSFNMKLNEIILTVQLEQNKRLNSQVYHINEYRHRIVLTGNDYNVYGYLKNTHQIKGRSCTAKKKNFLHPIGVY